MSNLEKFLKDNEISRDDWNACINELFKNGISNGCYQDYFVLTKVIEYLTH